jgi:hypothetical protein
VRFVSSIAVFSQLTDAQRIADSKATLIYVPRPRLLRFAPAAHKKLADQRKSAGKRDDNQIFHKRGALLELVLNCVGFGLFGRHHSADIFNEVHSAFFAFSTGAL